MMGQDKQFTLHDLIPGGKTQSRFVPRNLKQLQWCGDTYLYVKGDSMMSGESTKAVKVAFTRQQLNEALAVAGAQSRFLTKISRCLLLMPSTIVSITILWKTGL